MRRLPAALGGDDDAVDRVLERDAVVLAERRRVGELRINPGNLDLGSARPAAERVDDGLGQET